MERRRKSRVIALVHRQETMSLLGFPLFRYIDINDSEEILRAIKLTSSEVPIDLIIHTPGGLVLAASQIAHALKKHPGKVTVFVPHYAMSGGTLIALAADEIVLDDNAVLGPVDPQIGQEPAASILRVLEQKDKNEIDDATLIHADMAGKALRQVRQCVAWILEERMGRDAAAALAETLSQGAWTHDRRGGDGAGAARQHRHARGSLPLHDAVSSAPAAPAVGRIHPPAVRPSAEQPTPGLMDGNSLSGALDKRKEGVSVIHGPSQDRRDRWWDRSPREGVWQRH
jgi:ClpP class serine protease